MIVFLTNYVAMKKHAIPRHHEIMAQLHHLCANAASSRVVAPRLNIQKALSGPAPASWLSVPDMQKYCLPYTLVYLRPTEAMRSGYESRNCSHAPVIEEEEQTQSLCVAYPICMLELESDVISRYVNDNGVWEEQYLLRVQASLKKASYPIDSSSHSTKAFLLDAGTNQGIYAIWAALLGYKVVAFEANPSLMPLLKKSFFLAGVASRITLFNNALSDRRANVHVQEEEGNAGGSAVIVIGTKTTNQDDGNRGGPISQITLDDALESIKEAMGKAPLGYMKVDIEGHEARLFSGGVKFMQHYYPRVFQMEVSTVTPERSTWLGCDCERFERVWRALNYTRKDNFWHDNSTFCQREKTFGESLFERDDAL